MKEKVALGITLAAVSASKSRKTAQKSLGKPVNRMPRVNVLYIRPPLQDIHDVAECRDCVGRDVGRFDVPTVEEDGVEAGVTGSEDVGLQVVANHQRGIAAGA